MRSFRETHRANGRDRNVLAMAICYMFNMRNSSPGAGQDDHGVQ